MSSGLGLRRSPEMSGKIEKAGEAGGRRTSWPRALDPQSGPQPGSDAARAIFEPGLPCGGGPVMLAGFWGSEWMSL